MKNVMRFAAVVLAVALFSAGRVWAAYNAFLNFGDIKGESTDKDHKDWIEVLSFSQGPPQQRGAGPTGRSATMSASRIATNEMTITKRIDLATPRLTAACSSGQHFPKVILATPYMTYEMHDVMISSARVGGAGGIGGNQTVVLTYRSILMRAVPATPPHVAPGALAPNKALIRRP
jgi:type VI secretion system secreted protein Hcp